MLLGSVPLQEAFVEIVDEVGCAPIELRPDGRHVGRCETPHHEAAPWRRQQINERLYVCRFVIVGRANSGRIEEYRAKSGDDPGPRPDRVMRDVEETRGEDA